MNDDEEPKAAAPEHLQAIFELIGDISEKTAENDLAGLQEILAKMEGIVAATGVDVPDFSARMNALKGGTASAQTFLENTDAALWVGDLKRAEMLNSAGPTLDISAMMGDVLAAEWSEDEEDATEDEFEDEDDLWGGDEDIDGLAARLGLDVDGLEGFDPGPDHFADIADGKTGAIEAVIASGVDLNRPAGDAQHSAILAALDAPGRRADGIRKLIEAGADPSFIHVQGDNTLSWAMGYHHPDTVTAESEIELMTLLASHGVEVNHRIEGQWITLHRAVIQGDASRVAGLLATGPDLSVDVFEEFHPEKLAGATVVMLAAPKPDVLKLLLDAGADAGRQDANGRSAIDFVATEAAAASLRADAEDPWTIEHADALKASHALLAAHLGI